MSDCGETGLDDEALYQNAAKGPLILSGTLFAPGLKSKGANRSTSPLGNGENEPGRHKVVNNRQLAGTGSSQLPSI